ncbi:hypothetical protein ACH5RR_037861 [Cinchona calisaya]|uniref:Uncharacterized protein n=1 Tax=Cinchona calisaya TaxID=153742 RepID=A0ABD2Y7G3_9GENT
MSGDPGPSSVNHTIFGFANMNLRQEYIKILELMLVYNTAFGVVPRADSDELHDFVQENGLINLSQANLTRAVVFMEESFQKTVKDRGRNAHLLDHYLEDRFQLSKKLWGLPPREEINNPDIKGKALVDDHNLDDHLLDDEDIDDLDDAVVDQKQDDDDDAKDIAILRIILEFKIKNDGTSPEPDSDDLYRILVSLGICNIKLDELVDRILFLEEKYNRIEINRIMGDDVDFVRPSGEEIYNLSSRVFCYNPDEISMNLLGSGAEQLAVGDGADEHIGPQFQGGVENRVDDQGGVETIGELLKNLLDFGAERSVVEDGADIMADEHLGIQLHGGDENRGNDLGGVEKIGELLLNLLNFGAEDDENRGDEEDDQGDNDQVDEQEDAAN